MIDFFFFFLCCAKMSFQQDLRIWRILFCREWYLMLLRWDLCVATTKEPYMSRVDWNQCNLSCIIDLLCVNVSFWKCSCGDFSCNNVQIISWRRFQIRLLWVSVMSAKITTDILFVMPLNIFIISGTCAIPEMFVISTYYRVLKFAEVV